MWIHLLRHGIAVDPDDPACPPSMADSERFLTDKGKARTRTAAKGMLAIGISPDRVLVSPYVRAQQTADIAVEMLGAEQIPRQIVESLTPMGDPSRVLEAVAASGGESVLCVGHAPNVDLVVARLLGSSSTVTRLKKAGLVTVECRGPALRGAVLHGVYPAAALRKMGGG